MGFRMMRNLCGMAVLMFIMAGCSDSSDNRTVEAEPTVTVSGKVSQTYVNGAMIIADRAGADGLGNYALDEDEKHTFTGPDGSYELEIPESYGDYVLYSQDGTVTDTAGEPVPAFPMLYPYSRVTEDAFYTEGKGPAIADITPVTTLAAYDPDLMSRLSGPFDQDIASPEGATADVMRLAKTVETVLAILTDKNSPLIADNTEKLAVVEKLAAAFREVSDFDDNAAIRDAVIEALNSALADNTVLDAQKVETEIGTDALRNAVAGAVDTVLAAIPVAGTVVEDTALLLTCETAVAEALALMAGNSLVFDPIGSVIPFPNDVAWALQPGDRKGLVTFDPDSIDDPAFAALYTAINHLNLKGLSPNAFIGIPLSRDTKLKEGFEDSIRLINMNLLVGGLYSALGFADPAPASAEAVTDELMRLDADGWSELQAATSQPAFLDQISAPVEIKQDAASVKLYPLGPLEADAPYLAVIFDRADDPNDDLEDVNGSRVKAPPYYTFLKSEEPLTGAAAALEELRLSYAPIYNYYLKALGFKKADTLEIFTFTTADRTLSLIDFAVIAGAIGSGDISNLENSLTEGLAYDDIRSEFGFIHQSAGSLFDRMAGGELELPFVSEEGDAFTSFNITSLIAPEPATVDVPYAVFNGELYTDTVVIFQHGYTRQKEDGQYFNIEYPLLAMDMPEHGGRTPEGFSSGEVYLTANMGQNRVNIFQTLFDQTLMLKNLRAGHFDIDGDGTPDTPTYVYFSGQSMGAITGSMFLSNNSDGFDKAVLNVGGGNYAALVDRAGNEEIRSLVENFNIEPNTTEYFVTLGLLQMLMDPCDPVYLANDSIRDRTLFQTAYQDTVVPNVSNDVLTFVIGGYRYETDAVALTDFTEFDPDAYSGIGWYEFGGKAGMTDNWVTHGFLLNPLVDGYPEADGFLNGEYVYGAHTAATAQIEAFFNK